jgi:probable rRNA maturation factor
MKPEMPKKNIASSVRVNIRLDCKAVAFNEKSVINLIHQTAEHFGLKNAQVNIAIVNDEQIAAMNRRFLDKKGITDVISFDVSDDESKEKTFDIAVNARLAQRQAKSRGITAHAELALYILHGLLHHLGFNDATSRQAAKMHQAEDDILQKFGFGIVYDADKR